MLYMLYELYECYISLQTTDLQLSINSNVIIMIIIVWGWRTWWRRGFSSSSLFWFIFIVNIDLLRHYDHRNFSNHASNLRRDQRAAKLNWKHWGVCLTSWLNSLSRQNSTTGGDDESFSSSSNTNRPSLFFFFFFLCVFLTKTSPPVTFEAKWLN